MFRQINDPALSKDRPGRSLCRSLKKVALTAPLIFLLSACGKKEDPELTAFQNDMNTFYQSVNTISNEINSIDPDAENATSLLLEDLDRMNLAFTTMAAVNVPEQFSSVEAIADDAATYMNQAVVHYHSYYSSPENDESLRDTAGQYYEAAMERVTYIGQIMMGETPSGNGITVTTE